MKVVHVLGACVTGGAETFVKALLLELKRQGADVHLWVLSRMNQTSWKEPARLDFEEAYVRELARHGIGVTFIGKRPGGDWLFAWREIRRLARDQCPDVVHVHLESVALHVGIAMWRTGIPVVQTSHNTILHYPFLVRSFFRRAMAGYVAISEGVRNLLVRLGYPERKIVLIFNGIALDAYPRVGREETSCVNQIVAVGRLCIQKNHANLLVAMSLLKDRLEAEGVACPRLVLVGDGELRSELEDMAARLHLKEHVSLLGVRQDVRELLLVSDIYVMSSDWEGLSISLIEAMACGLPIIATDVGSNGEIVEHDLNGILVEKGNSRALADEMYRLTKDSALRARLAKSARENAERFSIESCARDHWGWYKSLTAES
jgi:L-malate glycosyltransferase